MIGVQPPLFSDPQYEKRKPKPLRVRQLAYEVHTQGLLGPLPRTARMMPVVLRHGRAHVQHFATPLSAKPPPPVHAALSNADAQEPLVAFLYQRHNDKVDEHKAATRPQKLLVRNARLNPRVIDEQLPP